eukprot:5225836-Pleurochrysis_carterae.AAC.2
MVARASAIPPLLATQLKRAPLPATLKRSSGDASRAARRMLLPSTASRAEDIHSRGYGRRRFAEDDVWRASISSVLSPFHFGYLLAGVDAERPDR